ncbi:MAG: VWA domain-containing protein [Ignavibacteria bacterium]|jgi:hypothetical protein
MSGINSIDISFGGEPLLIFSAVILLSAYSIYIYKYTIPAVSTFYKTVLTILRAVAIVLILFLIFEPLISIERINKQNPVNYIFIDNSKSIVQKDSTGRADKIKSFVKNINQNNVRIVEFGEETKHVNDLDSLLFNGGSTNFDNILDFLKNSEENIVSASIISDGIITNGGNPVNGLAKLNIPVYTVGLGDPEIPKDIEVKKILYNEYIYTGTESKISAVIINKEFSNRQITVKFFVDNSVVEQKQIKLNEQGINEVEFDFTFDLPGEKNIRIEADKISDELNTNNNFKSASLTILNNKLKILLLAGSPSADLSFIKKSLLKDKNLDVNPVVQLSAERFTDENINVKIDSANILFLIGFPNTETPAKLFENIWQEITSKSKPYFILLSHGIDLQKLKSVENDLPFKIGNISSQTNLVQPEISDANSGLLKHNNSNYIYNWNNLPPVVANNSNFLPKPESNVISESKTGNIFIDSPLIITRTISNKRALAVLAANIWKWKLQRTNIDLFDSFINNAVKWLNTQKEQKQFILSTGKKIYFQGENVEFNAQVYDETFTQLNNADVKVSITSGGNSNELVLTNTSSGRYTGKFKGDPGKYEYSAEAKIGDKSIGKSSGKFNIENVEIEYLNTQMDLNFLYSLSENTNGKYFSIDNYLRFKNEINIMSEDKIKQNIINSNFNLRLNKWLLFLLITFFSFEWFLRKKAGML